MNITAMSFNLRVCRLLDFHRSWVFRRESAALAVAAQKPCLVGFQEITGRMLAELAPLLPDYGYVGTGRNKDGGGEHNAIFYHKKRLAPAEWGQLWLSEQPRVPGSIGWDARYPRICTWARLKLLKEPAGYIHVYNTHLDHIGRKAKRHGALLIWETIKEHQERFGYTPVLLSGDFNAGPEHPVIRFFSGEDELDGERSPLANAFADPLHAGKTHHGFLGGKLGKPIDFLFGGYGLLPLHGDVIRSRYNGRYPSDHYPVSAVFRLQRLTPRTARIP